MTNVSTIGTATRDYADIDLWEADVQGVLSDIEEGQCYNDSDFTDNYIIAGSTTTASFFMRLTVASGQQHTGTRGTGVTLAPSSNGHTIHVQDDYTEIFGLEITHGNVSASDEGIRVEADNVFIDSCLIYEFDASGCDGIYTSNWNTTFTVQNCIIIDCDRGGIHLQIFSTTTDYTQNLDVINTTIIRCGVGLGLRPQRPTTTINVDAYNTLFVENTEDWGLTASPGGTPNMSGDYNIYDTDPDTLVPGGNSINLAAARVSDDLGDFTSGNWVFFDDLTIGAEDLHLQGTSTENAAIEGGIGPSSQALVPTLDIDGDTRSGSVADVGADEVVSAVVASLLVSRKRAWRGYR